MHACHAQQRLHRTAVSNCALGMYQRAAAHRRSDGWPSPEPGRFPDDGRLRRACTLPRPAVHINAMTVITADLREKWAAAARLHAAQACNPRL